MVNTNISMIMRDITEASNGGSDVDHILVKIEKAAKNGKSSITIKSYDKTLHADLESIFSTYNQSIRLSSNKYDNHHYYAAEAKSQMPKIHAELIDHGFTLSARRITCLIFSSYDEVTISW